MRPQGHMYKRIGRGGKLSHPSKGYWPQKHISPSFPHGVKTCLSSHNRRKRQDDTKCRLSILVDIHHVKARMKRMSKTETQKNRRRLRRRHNSLNYKILGTKEGWGRRKSRRDEWVRLRGRRGKEGIEPMTCQIIVENVGDQKKGPMAIQIRSIPRVSSLDLKFLLVVSSAILKG